MLMQGIVLGRIGTIRPFLGYGESTPWGILQDQSLYTGDEPAFQNRETLSVERMERMGDLSTSRRRAVGKCSWL